MEEINSLFKDCKVTLIVRSLLKNEAVVIYSNDMAKEALNVAQEKLKENLLKIIKADAKKKAKKKKGKK